ncbi:MAG: hypothetical protein H6625_02680 [Bdellovibrionaceae bacterium]|nr:hypothetical protein [Pseudobdellovibrionaceae bacterium]
MFKIYFVTSLFLVTTSTHTIIAHSATTPLSASNKLDINAGGNNSQTTLPTNPSSCEFTLTEDDNAEGDQAKTFPVKFRFKSGALSNTRIRFYPWSPVSLSALANFRLANNPDSDSSILHIGNGRTSSETRYRNHTSPNTHQLQLTPFTDNDNDNDNDLSVERLLMEFENQGRPSTHVTLHSPSNSSSLTTQQSSLSTNVNNPVTPITLQRLGQHRYFEFQAYDSSLPLIARILDIQEVNGELSVLAEWVDNNQNTTTVGLLNYEELLTIQRSSSHYDFSELAEAAFNSLIDENSLAIKYGFKKSQLPVLFNEGTRPRIVAFDSNLYRYLTLASLHLYPNFSSSMEAYFSMADQAPSSDMIQGLDPNYTYNWIINENGELQLSVHTKFNKDSTSLPRPSLYLLSKGRGILMGGHLIFRNNRWQAFIDTDGGFYGILSTQDVEIDISDDILGIDGDITARYFGTQQKIPVIPYLRHLDDYVFWIQEAFFNATGFTPEVYKYRDKLYWEKIDLWHQANYSQSRANNQPTTPAEAERFTLFEKYFKNPRLESEGTRHGYYRSSHRSQHKKKKPYQQAQEKQRKARVQLNRIKDSWTQPRELIEYFQDNLNSLTDISVTLWALKIDVTDGTLNLDDEKTVAKNYRKITSEYHPDKLTMRRAPIEQLSEGAELIKIVTIAWNVYKLNRKNGAFK